MGDMGGMMGGLGGLGGGGKAGGDASGLGGLGGGDMSSMLGGGGGDMTGGGGGWAGNDAMGGGGGGMGGDPTGSMGAQEAITGGFGGMSADAGPAGTTGTMGGVTSDASGSVGGSQGSAPAAGTTGQGSAQPSTPPQPPPAPQTPAQAAATWEFGGPPQVAGPTSFTPQETPQTSEGTGKTDMSQVSTPRSDPNAAAAGGQPMSGMQGQNVTNIAKSGGDPTRAAVAQALQSGQGRNLGGDAAPSWTASAAVPTDLSGGEFPAAGDEVAQGGDTSGDRMGQPGYKGDPYAGDGEDKPAATAEGEKPADTAAAPKTADSSEPAAKSPQGTPQEQATRNYAQGGFNPQQMMPKIMRDIMGLMSGNPQSLMSLIQDLARMGGGQGMGGQMPGMGGGKGNPLAQMMGSGMMGGVNPMNRPWAPGYNPQTGQWASPQAREDALRRIQSGEPPPGQGQRPPQAPRQRSDAPASGHTAYAAEKPATDAFDKIPPEQRGGMSPTMAALTEGQARAHGAAAGTGAAASPLSRDEVKIPAWSPAARRGGAPMTPSQPSVDRSRFANTSEATLYRAAWMVNGEVGKGAPTRAQIVQLETAFNRAHADKIPIEQALWDKQQGGRRGYYQSAYPGTYREDARPSASEFEKFKRDVWEPVKSGSNLSDVGWGPMTGNGSGGIARDAFAKGQNGYKLPGGDTYFDERPGVKYPTAPARAPTEPRQTDPGFRMAGDFTSSTPMGQQREPLGQPGSRPSDLGKQPYQDRQLRGFGPSFQPREPGLIEFLRMKERERGNQQDEISPDDIEREQFDPVTRYGTA